MNEKLTKFAQGMKRGLMVAVLSTMIALTNPVNAHAEPEPLRGTLQQFLDHPDLDMMQELFIDRGHAVIIVSDSNPDQVLFHLEPGTNIREFLEANQLQSGLQLLTQTPQLTTERNGAETNSAVRDFLMDFFHRHIVPNQGRNMGNAGENFDLDQLFREGMREALGRDTASAALGLNYAGKDIMFGPEGVTTKTFSTRQNNGAPNGSFFAANNMADTGINTIQGNRITPRNGEDMIQTKFWEFIGRNMGWEPVTIMIALEHFGMDTSARSANVGLARDASIEIGVARAAGGIHTHFEAADQGTNAMSQHFNENIGSVNPHFNFDYDMMQMARTVESLMRHGSTIFLATAVGGVDGYVSLVNHARTQFANRAGIQPGVITPTLNQLQQNIRIALDENADPQSRQIAAELVNRDIEILASIGFDLGMNQNVSANENRFPVVNTFDSHNIEWAGRAGDHNLRHMLPSNHIAPTNAR